MSGKTKSPNIAWLWLVLAAALWPLAGGRWVIGAAAWLAPVFMLRWLRVQRPAVAWPFALAAAAGGYALAWRGIASVMMPPAYYALFMVAAAAVYLLPYLADRLLAPRLEGSYARAFVFPAAVVTLEYVLSRVSPLGTWNALAYTQVQNLALVQLAAATGIWGVGFLVAWGAGVVNWAWELGFSWPRVRRGVVIYAAVVSVVMLAGGARLATAPRKAPTVRVAGIVADAFFATKHRDVFEGLLAGRKIPPVEREALRREAAADAERLFARTAREARAGARVVCWGEVSAMAFAEDEAALVARGRALAREEKIYLAMGLGVLDDTAAKPFANKLVLVDPAGNVCWDYLKSVPVPGPEAALTRRGDGRLPTLATPYGRLAGAICYDMDFPALVRPAGRAGADVMLVPSHDWWELGDLHADIAVFRAVENGFALVRPDNDAISVATDCYGRTLGTLDYFATADRDIVAHVPSRGARTIYSRVGDLFAWLAAAVLIVVILIAARGKRH